MASIFEGVPFIVRIPGAYNEDSSALNAGLAAGAAAGRTRSYERMQMQQNALEDRKLTITEKDQKAREQLQTLRMNGLLMEQDATLKDIQDKNALAAWMPLLNENPAEPIPDLWNLKNKESAVDFQAKVLAKNGIIDQKSLMNNTVKNIQELAPALRQEYMARLGQEGATPELQSDLSNALALNPTPANFAYAQSKQREAVEAGDEIGAATWDARLQDLSRAHTYNKAATTLSPGTRAAIDAAKTEFRASTKDLDPADPEFVKAKNKYVRTVEGLGGASNNAMDILNRFGLDAQTFQERLGKAAQGWQQQNK